MDREKLLQQLLQLLQSRDIDVKYKSGIFKGGLVRYEESQCLYLNRKTNTEEQVKLIINELAVLDEPFHDIPQEVIDIYRQN